jgi:glycosyltransferase involved in cell wall biosynthesis
MSENSSSVSVCICSFNQAQYLENAIRSAAEQSLAPTEILVSDDCSTDGSQAILKRLSEELPNLKVFYHRKNTGIAQNTDFCLRQGTGDFIVRLDSDDILLPSFIEQLSQAFEDHPSAGYAHAAVQEIDEAGTHLNVRRLFRSSIFQCGDDAFRASIKGYKVAANIIMFRKEALLKVDYMKGRPNFGEDYHLTSDISNAGFGNIYFSDILSKYRIWTDLGKTRQKRKLNEIVGIRKVFEDIIEPGFRTRGWNRKVLDRSRANFACGHANCLASKHYTKTEKMTIEKELKVLSPSFKVQLYCQAYLRGFGQLIDLVSDLRLYLRSSIKTYLFQLSKLK